MAVPTRTYTVKTILSIFLGLLALAGSANSQSASGSPSSSPSSTSTTSSAAEATHTVNVGLVCGFSNCSGIFYISNRLLMTL